MSETQAGGGKNPDARLQAWANTLQATHTLDRYESVLMQTWRKEQGESAGVFEGVLASGRQLYLAAELVHMARGEHSTLKPTRDRFYEEQIMLKNANYVIGGGEEFIREHFDSKKRGRDMVNPSGTITYLWEGLAVKAFKQRERDGVKVEGINITVNEAVLRNWLKDLVRNYYRGLRKKPRHSVGDTVEACMEELENRSWLICKTGKDKFGYEDPNVFYSQIAKHFLSSSQS